ncbi:cell wall hydrolase [Natroniella acetigena]|uniref:cell wall hydrolase n=1 Tax=Natroniella acetigena TaxID=52004 RepID=UPI00200B1B4F|nr:cell wall hydrolase [Natroniella acetigena]MCK8827375.1 cell wall hydrolase [Natroniella acetigena]
MKNKHYKLIASLLVFTILFPFLSGFILFVPAYASEGGLSSLTENRGFLSIVQSLLMLFFFSSFTGDSSSEDYLGDSYESAASDEEPADSSYQRLYVTSEERDILARAVYSEARGEPFKGQVAVAGVVINRVESPEFPNDVEGVVFQQTSGGHYAFSAVLDGQIDLTPDKTAYEAVDYALSGWDPSNGALYYYNPVTATAQWMFDNMVTESVIGRHHFGNVRK